MRVWFVRGCGSRWARAVTAAAALLAALLAAALLWRASRPHHRARLRLRAPPHHVAAALADFSNHPSLFPNIESWRIQEEESKLRWWRYSVKFVCGGRCAGAAVVQHEAVHSSAPAHRAHADTHLLRFTHSYCTKFPILSWPQLCEVIYTDVEVSNTGQGGSYMSVSVRGRCLPLVPAGDACAKLSFLPGTLHSWINVLSF